MLWQELQKKLKSAVIEGTLPAESRPVIYIDSAQQLLSCISDRAKAIHNYPVSTSRYGLGQQQDSFQTPAGIHKVAQKIGDNEPIGRVFRSRKPSEEICLAGDYQGEDDVITTRILWLQGLEPSLNCGGDVDTFKRYIYIHGTTDEDHIGQPASIGCIRMKNQDIMELFEQVREDDLVIIE